VAAAGSFISGNSLAVPPYYDRINPVVKINKVFVPDYA